MRLRFLLIAAVIFLLSCENNEKLPYLGNSKIVDGEKVYHTIPSFSFVNQNGETITEENYKNKVYLADFFFTTCPTICPTVMSQMVRIYDKYENNPEVMLLSFSLDPKRDTIGALKAYAENLEVSAPKWNMVTGEKAKIHDIVDDYMNIVIDDPSAPGGINHSGKIILIDKDNHIRSFADGTDKSEVDRLLKDIDILLKEYE